MKPLQLYHSVITPDGKELLPGGTYLTKNTMETLVSIAEKENYPVMRLSEYGSVVPDLRRICEKSPYNRILSDSVRREEIFNAIGRVGLVKPLIDIYGFFKTKDPYTYMHILKVFAMSLYLAQELTEDRKEFAREVAAAPSHDFGKICIPLSILKKADPLDMRERQWLSHHTAAGYVLLSYYLKDPFHPAAITARDHHERRDGSGYPRGIIYRNKMVEIIAVSDIFDALISNRPYRSASYDVRAALEELSLEAKRGAIEKDILHALIRCYRKEYTSIEDSKFSHEIRNTPPPGNRYRGAISCHFESDNDSKAE